MKKVGSLWNNSEYQIIEKDGKMYVLNYDSWNGEEYGKCWEVLDDRGFKQIDDKKYTIKPIYEFYRDDDYEIVDYEIVEE